MDGMGDFWLSCRPGGEMIRARAAEIVFGDLTQHMGLVGTADDYLADEILRTHYLARGEAMVAWHEDDERLPVDYVVPEVIARFEIDLREWRRHSRFGIVFGW